MPSMATNKIFVSCTSCPTGNMIKISQQVAKRWLSLLALVWPFLAPAQNTLWADRVIDFSTELFSIEFSARQVLGKPDVLPVKEESPLAWSPRTSGKQEFITVGFERALPVSQVAIAETFNPGALYRAYAYDPAGEEHLLFEFPTGLKNTNGGMFTIFFPLTEFPVASVKLVYDGTRVAGRINIDAIAVSDSPFPIRAIPDIPTFLRRNLQVEKLGNQINSGAGERKPLMSPDQKILYFTRANHPQNTGGEDDEGDIWISEYDDKTGTWSAARNAGTPLNNKGDNSIGALTPYGENTIALVERAYAGKGTKEGFSLSMQDKGKWSAPVAQRFVAHEELKGDFELGLSANRKILLIANQGQVSYGGKDLYVSFLQPDGYWSDPLNLGPQVNTLNEENSPYLLPDGVTLYFSSNGRAGYGGGDIYETHRLDNTWTNWSTPQNLGAQINSPHNEHDFYIPTGGTFAYFSREEEGNADIFSVRLPLFEYPAATVTLTGIVLNQVTHDSVEARITMADSTFVVRARSFTLKLLPEKAYPLTIEARGFITRQEVITLSEDNEHILLLTPEKEEIHTFENITFASNDSTIHEGSFGDLEKVISLMQSQPEIKIEIASHTDALGTEEDNMNLSRGRATAIRNYLITKGIDPSRLTTRWYGERRPVATNDTEEGRRKNRRVEFRVIR